MTQQTLDMLADMKLSAMAAELAVNVNEYLSHVTANI